MSSYYLVEKKELSAGLAVIGSDQGSWVLLE